MYFHAASMAPSVPSMATSNALTTVVTSIATHNSPRSLTMGAMAIAQAKRLRPANNRRRYTRLAARSARDIAHGKYGCQTVEERRRQQEDQRQRVDP